MVTTIRIHSFVDDNPAENGTSSCDFRGAAFVGDNEGDHHKTLFELDVEDTDPLVAEALLIGPQINGLLQRLQLPAQAQAQVGNVRLRIGVWSKVAEGN